jgi:N-acetylglucosamine-6-phosphate deacetylase
VRFWLKSKKGIFRHFIMLILLNGTVVTPNLIIPNGAVSVEDGLIRAVGPQAGLQVRPADTVIDAHGGTIVPGFVDIHTHGALGIDVSEAGPEDLHRLGRFLPSTGVTTFVPTTVTMPEKQVFQTLERFMTFLAQPHHPQEARIPGIHLEGPFINKEQKGAHNPDYIILPEARWVRQLRDYARIIKIITVAPELPGVVELVSELSQAGIVCSIGHTMAMEWDIEAGIRAGLKHVTHLMNNMNTLARVNMKRVAGTVETALVDDRLTAEVIADRNILSATLFRLAFLAKGVERLAAVTDACPLTGLPPGEYQLWGRPVILEQDKVFLPDRSAFAGSVITMDRCFRTLLDYFGMTLQDAVFLVTATPARIIGEGSHTGSIEPGKDADLVLLDQSFQVTATVIQGKMVYPSAAEN